MAAAASARNGADLTVPVFVIAAGWHTELALPVKSLRGRLAHFADAFPGARFLVFGWGQRDYYMAREPTIGDLLGAALPSPAVSWWYRCGKRRRTRTELSTCSALRSPSKAQTS